MPPGVSPLRERIPYGLLTLVGIGGLVSGYIAGTLFLTTASAAARIITKLLPRIFSHAIE